MTRVYLELDTSRATAPIEVAMRWILKVLLRRYRIVNMGCRFEDDETAKPAVRSRAMRIKHKKGE